MSITARGTIQRSDMGSGTWILVTDAGETYELQQGTAKELLKPGLKVKVEGQVREDVMTLAMVGPVLEVKSFEVAK
ncbi:MAG: hypothetical protein JO235_19920 [Chroococcidiopsidaceae cyanobacterium CP_BM_RX_35]|nr:hypothetical protein [Chroococcidiopsidaceae cyanobacterium CP_BM_RX_35]